MAKKHIESYEELEVELAEEITLFTRVDKRNNAEDLENCDYSASAAASSSSVSLNEQLQVDDDEDEDIGTSEALGDDNSFIQPSNPSVVDLRRVKETIKR